ncbi:MAG: NAD(P)-binding protein [Phycisphaerales bacterium]
MGMSRRQFVGSGLAALAAGLSARLTLGGRPPLGPPLGPPGHGGRPRPVPAGVPCDTGGVPIGFSGPLRPIAWTPESVMVDGMPFEPWWLGESFRAAEIPFHRPELPLPPFEPPEPQETTEVVVIGGGLAGLTAAYELREFSPIVFELHPRFGGTAQGETWRGTPYSLGSAYFIAPDEGSYLESLYRTLGVDRIVHESPPTDDPYELNGSVVGDLGALGTLTADEREAFRQYRDLVAFYGENYPEIPLIDNGPGGNDWILDLDQMTLEQSVRNALTVPVPEILRSAIEGYCFSSFNSSWRQLSAASGWNFIAAEEFGRWVLPGGNAGLVAALVDRLRPLERGTRRGCGPAHLRAGCRVVDIRKQGDEHMLVTWKGVDGALRSLTARRVVFSCPKHLLRHMMPEVHTYDPELAEATHRVSTASYIVANALIEGELPPQFQEYYDLFLLGNGSYPATDAEIPPFARITDAVNAGLSLTPTGNPGAPSRHGHHHHGHTGRRHPHHALESSVLTMYWPLPFGTSRFTIIEDEAWLTHARSAAAQVRSLLGLMGVNEQRVRQLRLARWGHSMPISTPGFIASGTPEIFRRPYLNRVYFAHSDNWALPAVETALLEAKSQADRVAASL